MKKAVISILLISVFFGCKEKAEPFDNKISSTRKIDSGVNGVNYHKMIDLVLTSYSEANENKIVHVEYKPKKNPLPGRYKDYVIKHPILSKEEKELALELMESGKTQFKFNKKKLNGESQNILNNLSKTTDKNITYIFNSFLSNNENDLVISTVGVLINNESFNATTAGAELIIFFKKENDNWKLTNTISTIEY